MANSLVWFVGAMRGLRTKVWVWSGVEEEVEILENGGEGGEEGSLLVWVTDRVSSSRWSGKPDLFLSFSFSKNYFYWKNWTI